MRNILRLLILLLSQFLYWNSLDSESILLLYCQRIFLSLFLLMLRIKNQMFLNLLLVFLRLNLVMQLLLMGQLSAFFLIVWPLCLILYLLNMVHHYLLNIVYLVRLDMTQLFQHLYLHYLFLLYHFLELYLLLLCFHFVLVILIIVLFFVNLFLFHLIFANHRLLLN